MFRLTPLAILVLGLGACHHVRGDSELPDSKPLDSGGLPPRERLSGQLLSAEHTLGLLGAEGDALGTSTAGVIAGATPALAAGAPDRSGSAGVVLLLDQPVEGWYTADQASVLGPGNPQANFGATLLSLPDSALAVGAFWDGNSQAGSVSVYFNLRSSLPGLVAFGEAGDNASLGMAWSKDLTGDGAPDLVVGAHGAEGAAQDVGRVTVFDLNQTGDLALADQDVQVRGQQALGWLGISVAVSDADGDGADDLLVGAMGEDGAATASGVAYVFNGPLSGAVSPADASLKVVGEGANDQLGKAAAGGSDVDGDGLQDWLISASEAGQGGEVWLLTGGPKGELKRGEASAVLSAVGAGDRAGFSVALPGDLDGDGFGDLLVGASRADGGATDGGAAYLLYGPVAGQRSLDSADFTLLGDQADSRLGISVSGAGDLDEDGYPDWLVGARAAGEGAGAVWIFLGP